jgi:hypothetical protein
MLNFTPNDFLHEACLHLPPGRANRLFSFTIYRARRVHLLEGVAV